MSWLNNSSMAVICICHLCHKSQVEVTCGYWWDHCRWQAPMRQSLSVEMPAFRRIEHSTPEVRKHVPWLSQFSGWCHSPEPMPTWAVSTENNHKSIPWMSMKTSFPDSGNWSCATCSDLECSCQMQNPHDIHIQASSSGTWSYGTHMSVWLTSFLNGFLTSY